MTYPPILDASGACPDHGVPWQWVPAGIAGPNAQRPGEPYDAFQRCPVRGCKKKPGRRPAAPQQSPQAVQQRTPAPQTNGAGEARLRAATAAWAAACKFYEVNERTGPELDALAVRGYQWIMRCYQGQPVQQPSADELLARQSSFDPNDPDFAT